MSPIIHQPTFEELTQTVGEDFVGELVEAYCLETPALLEQLQRAFEQNDLAAFTRLAHSIKSSSASLGALEFSALARQLELLGKQGDLSMAGDTLSALLAAYPLVQQALQNEAGQT